MSTSDDFTLPIGGVPHQATDDSDVMDDFDPDAYRLQSEKGNSGGRGDSCETGENSQRDLLSHQSRLTGEARVVEGPQQGDDDDDDDNQSTTRQGIQRSNTNQTSDLELEMKTDSESGQTPQHPLDPPRSSGSNRKEDEVEIEMNEPSTSQTTNNNNEEVVEGETVISDGVKTMTPTERTPEMKPLIDGDDEGSTAPPPAPPPPPPPPPAAAPPPPSFMDRFRLVAKKYFSSAVVRNRVSKSKRLTRMYTVMSTTKELVLPPDSIVGRYWYIIVALCAAVEFISFTRCLVFDNTFSRSELVIHFVTCFVNIVDAFLHIQRIVVTKRHRAFCIVDVISAAPLEIILFFDPTTHAVRSLISGCRACKIVAVPEMFGRSMPDAIDVDYVNFYYRWLPTALFIFWFLLFLHTLVIIRLLCAEKSESYHDAITWVWILLTSAPLSLDDVTSLPEQILSGFLMTASMILQGYVVGAMSMLVFSYNVKDENRTQMLVTLEMLKHYQLPVEVQHEVLSFQYHVLEDSSLRSNSSAALEKLPPSMLREIQLYVKVDILNRAKFFDGAPHECKVCIADVMSQKIIEPDEDIIVAGDIGEAMYFMFHGMADVTLPHGLTVATIRRGDFFGEIALLSPDSKRKATVTSLTYCDLLELHREDFDSVIEDFPEFLDKILEKREDLLKQNANSAPAPPPAPVPTAIDMEERSEADDESLAYEPMNAGTLHQEYDVVSTRDALLRMVSSRHHNNDEKSNYSYHTRVSRRADRTHNSGHSHHSGLQQPGSFRTNTNLNLPHADTIALIPVGAVPSQGSDGGLLNDTVRVPPSLGARQVSSSNSNIGLAPVHMSSPRSKSLGTAGSSDHPPLPPPGSQASLMSMQQSSDGGNLDSRSKLLTPQSVRALSPSNPQTSTSSTANAAGGPPPAAAAASSVGAVSTVGAMNALRMERVERVLNQLITNFNTISMAQREQLNQVHHLQQVAAVAAAAAVGGYHAPPATPYGGLDRPQVQSTDPLWRHGGGGGGGGVVSPSATSLLGARRSSAARRASSLSHSHRQSHRPISPNAPFDERSTTLPEVPSDLPSSDQSSGQQQQQQPPPQSASGVVGNGNNGDENGTSRLTSKRVSFTNDK